LKGIFGRYASFQLARSALIRAIGIKARVYNKPMSDEPEKEIPDSEGVPVDEDIAQLMEDHDIDEDKAGKVQELIDEGLDENDAVELADIL